MSCSRIMQLQAAEVVAGGGWRVATVLCSGGGACGVPGCTREDRDTDGMLHIRQDGPSPSNSQHAVTEVGISAEALQRLLQPRRPAPCTRTAAARGLALQPALQRQPCQHAHAAPMELLADLRWRRCGRCTTLCVGPQDTDGLAVCCGTGVLRSIVVPCTCRP